MIGYHYSPARNGYSIKKHGLLVPTKHPKLVVPVVCSEGHRNPHISLGVNPVEAWTLSGGFLYDRDQRGVIKLDFELSHLWLLYQVDLKEIPYRKSGCDEIQVRVDIPRRFVKYVGGRYINE